MGLDISHDTWHGAYSAFHRWRKRIAQLAGYPPLELMQGFYGDSNCIHLASREIPFKEGFNWLAGPIKEIHNQLPILWSSLKERALNELLYHSDCEGSIGWNNCQAIADELKELIPLMDENEDGGGHIGNWRETTQKFINGLETAARLKEDLTFG